MWLHHSSGPSSAELSALALGHVNVAEPLYMSEFKGEALRCDNPDVILPKCKQLSGDVMDGKTKLKEIIVFQPLVKSCSGDIL